jgi:hypothetical protein
MSSASTSFRRAAAYRHAVWVAIPVLLGLLALGFGLLRQGSTVVTQTRSVPPFGAVDLAGNNVVSVHVGAKQSVVVHARKDMLGRVSTRVVGGSLVIADVPSSHPTKGPMSVSVTVPSLRSLTLSPSGNGVITVTGVNAPSFTVTVAGNGVVRAGGKTTSLDTSVSGSGDVELGQLLARDVRAVVSGSGRIVVTAANSLQASVPGSGVIQYGGTPTRVVTSVTGSGAIVPG